MRRTPDTAHDLKLPRHQLDHKVRLIGSTRYTNAASGLYKIVEILPDRDGELQYRIKSDLERFDRVVLESQVAQA